MAVATSVSVTTSATSIVSNANPDTPGADWQAKTYALKNTTASDTVYLDGDNGVATSDFPWVAADGILTVTLEPGESLYGLVSTTSQTIKVLTVGR